MFKRLELSCPRCGRKKIVQVCDAVPRQRFDVRCCGGQVVTARVMAIKAGCTIREVTWESDELAEC